MKLFLLTLSISLFSLFSFSQLEMGKWRMHISPYNGIAIVNAGGIIYGVLENGIVRYDLQKEEQSLWTYANNLSDVSPSAIAYDSQTKNVIIGYENGNIDVVKNNSVYNLPAIVISDVFGLKRINTISVKNGYAYLATGVGIVVVDLKKKEIKDTYHPTNSGSEFIDIAFYKNDIYALTKKNLYVGEASNPFLAAPSQWHKSTALADSLGQGYYKEIEVFNQNLYLAIRKENIAFSDTLFRLEGDSLQIVKQGIEIYNVTASKNHLLIASYGKLRICNSSLQQVQEIYQYKNGKITYPADACEVKDGFFIADRSSGIYWSKNSYTSKSISFEGPLHNSAYRVKWRDGKLSVACGGFSGPFPKYSTAGGSTMEDGDWNSISILQLKAIGPANIRDFISTAINPNNGAVAYGTISPTPLIITKDGKVTKDYTLSNSLIEGWGGGGSGYISDVRYDEDGNLWVANAGSTRPLKVLSKEGIWFDFNIGGAVNGKITTRLVIDQNGIKWLGVEGLGVVAFDEGNNIDDKSDDRYQVFTTGSNSGALPSSNVQAIAVDIDNNIWVGTEEGMRVLYNTEGIFDAAPGQYNFQKILIKYGENVEIVLGTTNITSIKVDGGNRKWIGTTTSGVFLTSPDGLDIVHHFTLENSPLLSDHILDMALNRDTGEVFFVTEKGLVSYRSDASQGDSEYNNVIVFPNPVRPSYTGPITIQGIAYNSDVKITDVSGRLIYKTHSHGGTATWSGNTMDGHRAATGVYIIWTSIDSQEFKGHKVGKVVLINGGN